MKLLQLKLTDMRAIFGIIGGNFTVLRHSFFKNARTAAMSKPLELGVVRIYCNYSEVTGALFVSVVADLPSGVTERLNYYNPIELLGKLSK